jgi:hypothetical protein
MSQFAKVQQVTIVHSYFEHFPSLDHEFVPNMSPIDVRFPEFLIPFISYLEGTE